LFQINAQTELALRYNDISPLENHHCSIAFRLLEEPESNIFRNLSPGTYKKVREGIIRCILATDMARHNEIVNQFREIVPYFDPTNKAHVNLVSEWDWGSGVVVLETNYLCLSSLKLLIKFKM
jgi:high affinity cGMP-specific 3',5'-cyclic phosphodiesterase 9